MANVKKVSKKKVSKKKASKAVKAKSASKTVSCFISKKDIAKLVVPLGDNGYEKFHSNIQFSSSSMLDWPTEINPRPRRLSNFVDNVIKLNPLEEKIVESLMKMGDGESVASFDMMNRGALLFVEYMVYDDFGNVTHLGFKNYDGDHPINGIADGLTTVSMMIYAAQTIMDRVEHGSASEEDYDMDDWYLPVEIIVGCHDQKMIRKVVESRNSFHEVEQRSLSNYDGVYDKLKRVYSFSEMVSYHEREEGEVDVRDLLCELEGFLPKQGYGEDFQYGANRAYSSSGTIVKKMHKNPDEYNRVCLIADKIHECYEYTFSNMQNWYKKQNRKVKGKGERNIFIEVKDVMSGVPLIQELESSEVFGVFGFKTKIKKRGFPHKIRLAIVHSLRCLTELNDKGLVVWRENCDPIEFLKAHGPEIVGEAFRCFEFCQNMASAFGKHSQSHYNVYMQADKFSDRFIAKCAKANSAK